MYAEAESDTECGWFDWSCNGGSAAQLRLLHKVIASNSHHFNLQGYFYMISSSLPLDQFSNFILAVNNNSHDSVCGTVIARGQPFYLINAV